MSNEIQQHIINAFNLYAKIGEGNVKGTAIWNYVARRVEVSADDIMQWIDECADEAGCVRFCGTPEFRNTFYTRMRPTV